MSADFDSARSELNAARAAYAEARGALAAARATLRHAQAGDPRREDEARRAAEEAALARARARERLTDAVDAFEPVSDPRQEVGRLDDGYPCLLFPLRVETRFKDSELWVRVFPDACLIDTFEETLADIEVASGRAYWREIWRAGGVEADERAAWRGLVSSHGSGRAGWIADTYLPANPGDRPQKVNDTDVILVIEVEAPLPGTEPDEVKDFWLAHWRADGVAAGEAAARAALEAAVGQARAAELVERTRPFNLDDRPAPPLTPATAQASVAFVVLPSVTAKPTPWTQAPTADLLPDRFVLILEAGGKRSEHLGRPVPSPLVVGPDPFAPPDEQLHQKDGALVFPDELLWMADFERAVADGLGFKVDLSPEEATGGFDRLLVLGVRLSGDETTGAAELETLLTHHHNGRSGFSLVPQGTPTNNTQGAGSGFGRGADADATFDERRLPALFTPQTDPRLKQDGQWLAEALGIDPAVIARVSHAGGLDQRDARAMQTALWPATLGYFLQTMMEPLIGDDAVADARWYFTSYVSGRGAVPAVRIGDQPYGVLPTTAFSRISWLDPREGPALVQRARLGFLRRLLAILHEVDRDWAIMARQVARVTGEGDAHASLLGVLGLHPASVEFHRRYAESLNHLFNHFNFFGRGAVLFDAILRAGLDRPADELLRRLGHTGDGRPAVLSKYFLGGQGLLRGPVVDDRPLSETEPVRVYTDDARNYLRYLVDASGSLDALRLQEGFTDDQPPTALLYMLLRHALILGYADSGRELHRTADFDEAVLHALRREPAFVHVDTGAGSSESRWEPLYKDAAVVGGAGTVADHIAQILGTAAETRGLRDQIEAMERLADASTARLERAFAEHVDCCSHRFDAWLLGLVHLQLETMRAGVEGEAQGGVHLGAYAWLEDVRPQPRELTPVQLPADLEEVFGGDKRPPLTRDSANAGYIHAPSLNQAVTAAVLRSGYLAHASPDAPGALAVNLSSERVRLAMGVLEGVRNGQSLASLLGYRLERRLHDDASGAEVDVFVFELRKAFPLRADKLSTTYSGPGVSIEAIEARNVVDGLRLVEHVLATGERNYPFGLPGLRDADPAQSAAIDGAVDTLLDLHDAVADLALAEGVHQAVQGNFDRAGGTLAAYTTGRHPPEPEVVRTPATGVTLTHRVGLHLDPATAAGPGATPRALAEPVVDAWLATLLPGLGSVACRAVWKDPVTGTDEDELVTLAQLGLRPLDVLALVHTEDQAAMTELDDRVLQRVAAARSPRPDAVIEIRYMEHGPGQRSVFAVAPLFAHLRSLLARARPLRAGDLALPNEVAPDIEASARLDPARIEAVKSVADGLEPSLDAYLTTLDPLLADQPARRQDVLDGIDDFVDDAASLLARAAGIGLPQSGWGFALAWRRDQFGGLVKRLRERVARWDERLTAFGQILQEELALPGGTPDEDRIRLLQRAETVVSTTLDPLPASVPDLRTLVAAKGAALEARRDAFEQLADTADPRLSRLLAGIAALLPLSAFDSEPFDVKLDEDAVVGFAITLSAVVTGRRDDLRRRIATAQEQLDAHDAAGAGPARLDALQSAGRALLGEHALLVPEFTLPAEQGDALEAALAASSELLEHLENDTEVEFPVDEWLYGLARVRAPMRHLEQATVLAGVDPELVPAQLPHVAGERWLALDYPPDQTIDSERLLYTARYEIPFAKAAPQCGLLLDEWTEVVPGTTANTGITFHYDAPNSEAPQALLLVTPATWDGSWQWADLTGALTETLDLARKRAVEPVHVDATAYARFLPATIMAATLHGISIATALAANNHVYEFVRRDDG